MRETSATVCPIGPPLQSGDHEPSLSGCLFLLRHRLRRNMKCLMAWRPTTHPLLPQPAPDRAPPRFLLRP